jgi:hypothetical protein
MKFNRGIAPISVERFSWSKGSGHADASDLRDLQLHQVWDDSCDRGFSIVNVKTGQMRTFVDCGDVMNFENEMLATFYKSINERTGRIDKTAQRLTITIYND